jgi:hypothetical protein
MGPYLPLLHRALLLAQAYLAIYFATLALAAAATGLEPLRFFHAASPAAYAWTQAAQSLGFMGYLVLQMVDLVAVFSGAASPEDDGNGDAAKARRRPALLRRCLPPRRGRGGAPRELARVRRVCGLLCHRVRLRARREEEEGLPRRHRRRRRGVEEELSCSSRDT